MARRLVYQFRISLRDIKPEIWRRIVIPAESTFWELHVALQDAMGWTDSHLHVFRMRDPETERDDAVGIPLDDPSPLVGPHQPGWEVPVVQYLQLPGDTAEYEYDFGDGWVHDVLLEAIALRMPRKKYPQCLEGARACPPENCGGIPGYRRILASLKDPSGEGNADIRKGLGGGYDPRVFDAAGVRFDDPEARWQRAFGRGGV
jgi:hypothetical protein